MYSDQILAYQLQNNWQGRTLNGFEQIKFELEFRKNGLLIDFESPYYGDSPPPGPPGTTEGLWAFEVFEVFLAQGESYTEIELGPHGHYLVLELEGYRQRVSSGAEIRYRSYLCNGRWMGTALIPWELLPEAPWTFNAYAIHGHGASRQYNALFPVPNQHPDFHQLDFFQPLGFKKSA